MIIFLVICASVIAKMQCLNTDHSHNMPVRRKTDYKVNITVTNNDIEMVNEDNFFLFNYTGNKSKKCRKKPRRTTSRNDSNTETPQNIIPLSLKVTTSNPSREHGQVAGLEEKEERSNIQRLARETPEKEIRKIVQIWLLVYIVLAVPIWCTIGRCCCCLFCKRFKAQETIRQAKHYSMWNAPGVLRHKSGDIFYEPSEKEREEHEELEHLMRTL